MKIREVLKRRKDGVSFEFFPPKGIKKKMGPYLDRPDDMRKLGIELAIEQCQDLIKNGVGYLHFYTMNKSDTVIEILDGLPKINEHKIA